METEVTVLGRKKDEKAVKAAADNATKAFKDVSGRDVKVTVESTLSDDGCVAFPLIQFI